MSHELTTRKCGKTEMAYAGDVPWHGLGQRLEEGATIEQWQAAAGMDWRVKRSKVRFVTGADGASAEWPDNHVLFRGDTKEPLGLVSDAFKVVQPGEVLEFFRDLVAAGGMQLHTAGTLFSGKKFWALAKVAEACVAGADRVGGYVLLATAVDGTMNTELRNTTVRVVCNNTMRAARADGRDVFKVSHRSRFDPASAKQWLEGSNAAFAAFMDSARALARIKVGAATASAFCQELFRPGADLSVAQKRKHGEERVLELFRTMESRERLGGAGTAWHLVNAVTEYVDHHTRASTESHRLNSAWFGPGDDVKSKAMALALTL